MGAVGEVSRDGGGVGGWFTFLPANPPSLQPPSLINHDADVDAALGGGFPSILELLWGGCLQESEQQRDFIKFSAFCFLLQPGQNG